MLYLVKCLYGEQTPVQKLTRELAAGDFKSAKQTMQKMQEQAERFGAEIVYEAEALPVLQAAAAELAGRGATAAILGCSEFSILGPKMGPQPVALVDSVDVLAGACVRFGLSADPATR